MANDWNDWLRKRVEVLNAGRAQKDLIDVFGSEGNISKFFRNPAGNTGIRTIAKLADHFKMSIPEFFEGPPSSAHGRDDLVQLLVKILESREEDIEDIIGHVEYVIRKAAADAASKREDRMSREKKQKRGTR